MLFIAWAERLQPQSPYQTFLGMKYVSIIPSTNDTANGQGQPGQVSVILDVKDGVLEWLRKHRWELKTVSSVARAHLVKNS